jgi:hypothetical protein
MSEDLAQPDMPIPVDPAPVDDAPPTPPVVQPKRDNRMFEDFFPPLDLTSQQEEDIVRWLLSDLKTGVKYVNAMRDNWAIYRAVYALEYVEKFYPSMGVGANFSSGIICEKVIEGMDRLRAGIFSPRPFFVVDDKISNIQDIEVTHRMEWFLHTVLEKDMGIAKVIGLNGLFEYLLDGSFILEVDQMYESIPQRVIKTYTKPESLDLDSEKILDRKDYDKAMEQLNAGFPARVLIEEDVVTKNGLQAFRVDKVDHIIPPNVYEDRDIKFRARRMYLTEADFRVLCSDGVRWYPKDKVDCVLNKRVENRGRHGKTKMSEQEQHEELEIQNLWDLCYDWRSDSEDLGATMGMLPYKNTFVVYRVLCKYGYKTRSDPRGLIAKYVLIDVEPESRTILRARTYPHFHENPNYFHFKMGVKPKSYWGFGYGPRLINEDFLESNGVDLVLDASAMACFRPLLMVHPDEGGIIPFTDGISPFKKGFVKNINDVKALEIPPPSTSLLNVLLPLVEKRTANRTSITSLVQGNVEESDPRSPATKTAMLLKQASVGIDSIIKDWDQSGWEPLASFVWKASYELAVYNEESEIKDKIVFGGVMRDLEAANKITLEELSKDVTWKSQASSEYINSEAREQKFLQTFQFFTPLLQALAQINPDLYKKYFFRWMRTAAQELDVRGFKYLIPTEAELVQIPSQAVPAISDAMQTQMKSGESPGQVQVESNPQGQQKVGSALEAALGAEPV